MSPTQHFLYPDTDPRHRKAVEEAVNAQESEPQDVLAEALHDAMCDISHHDRPPARCSKWATYPNIAASVLPRLRAALVRTPETPERDPARTFTYWFLQQPVQRQREFVKSVFPDAFRTPETLDVAGLRREIEALPDVNPTPTVDTGTATDWPMVKRADVLRLTRQARERELVDPSGKDPTPRFHDTYLAASPAPDPGAGVVERLQQALRVATHRPHDQLGDPVEGFPVCSVCGAIQTGAATEPADGLELCPDCEGTGYVRHSGDMHFRVGRSEPVGPAPGETT